MNYSRDVLCRLALGAALSAIVTTHVCGQAAAPAVTIPETYALPSSAADTTKPGFLFDISQVEANTGPNSLANAEKQLAGLFGDNLADPNAVGDVASGPALPADPSTAPIRFSIPTVININ